MSHKNDSLTEEEEIHIMEKAVAKYAGKYTVERLGATVPFWKPKKPPIWPKWQGFYGCQYEFRIVSRPPLPAPPLFNSYPQNIMLKLNGTLYGKVNA